MPFRVAVLVASLALAAPAAAERAPGFSHSISIDYGMNRPRLPEKPSRLLGRLAELKRAGLRQVRLELSMNDTATIGHEAGHPAVELVRKIRALDLDVMAVVGVGSRRALLAGVSVDAPGYIETVSENVRAIAGRFAREGLKVDYQVENELNVAGLSTLSIMRWRTGRRWWDGRFKRRLLGELARAVRESDPGARVHTNFFDGLSDPMPAEIDASGSELKTLATAILGTEKNLANAVRNLSGPVDEVGIDLYTNYVLPLAVTDRLGALFDRVPALRSLGTADPGARLAARVALYRQVTGKPVRIAEIGYPTRSPLGHDAGGQARFIRKIMPAARASGAVAMNWFRLFDYDGRDDGPMRLLDPNRLIEPHFGLYDVNLDPKRGRRISPVDAYLEALRADQEPDR
jgi:hypothetical protein